MPGRGCETVASPQRRTGSRAPPPASSSLSSRLYVVNTVNIALVRADTIYKQGQQFDAQRNWISSVELYRRALDARRTEDHYMLFLGRALLEQAKQAPAEGAVPLPADAGLDVVLNLSPQEVSQMGRQELMRAAEIVLMQAQRVNPLNTDHTANLARLYRAWADFSNLQDQRQALLDKSVDAYNMAVQLSPNAAHLWNEKGNVHLARGERDLAEAAYLHSLSLDERYDQTYLLLADFYEREEALEKASELLRKGIEEIPRSAQLYSFLGVAAARQGNLGEAVEATLKVVELQPNNAAAMRNLALNYRDLELIDECHPMGGAKPCRHKPGSGRRGHGRAPTGRAVVSDGRSHRRSHHTL